MTQLSGNLTSSFVLGSESDDSDEKGSNSKLVILFIGNQHPEAFCFFSHIFESLFFFIFAVYLTCGVAGTVLSTFLRDLKAVECDAPLLPLESPPPPPTNPIQMT